MVIENYFQFNRKSLFNFFRFKLFILTCIFVKICHRRALKFIGNSTLPPKIFEYPIAGIRPSHRIPTDLNLTTTAIIQPVWSNSDHFSRILVCKASIYKYMFILL
jgi:hypothetical protein